MSRELPNRRWMFCLGLVMVAAVALAQQPAGGQGPYPAPPYYGYGGYGYGGGGGGWGAGSTPAGSYLTGLGSAIRAEGQYNLMSSEAAVNLQEADKRDIENQKLWTNTYFEMRKINQAYQDSLKGPKPTAEDWVRQAQEGIPPRPSTTALDPVTGQIAWPSVLQTDPFRKERDTLDNLFSNRAESHGAIGFQNHARIRSTVNEMLGTLKDHIRDVDTRTYLDARNFLSSLARESDYPAS